MGWTAGRCKPLHTLVLLASLTAGAQNADAETVLRAPRPVVWKDFLGVNVEFHAFTPAVYTKQMARLDQLGLGWIRWGLRWPDLEPAPQHYELAALDAAMTAAALHHYDVVAYLTGAATFDSSAPAGASNSDQYPPEDFSLFAERMTALAQHYPQVAHWQVWNEPNITWLPQADPAAYYSLLTSTANGIRSAVPNAQIVSGGAAYYGQMLGTTSNLLQSMIDQGLGTQRIIAAYHPYSDFPEGDSTQDKDFLSKANSFNSTLHQAGVEQVWATEWGWSSYNGLGDSQRIAGLRRQADYTLRRLALMSALDYQRIFLSSLSDQNQRANMRDRNFGLLDMNGEPKPVYTALANFLNATGPSLQPAGPPPVSAVPDDLYAVPWSKPDGTQVLIAWSASSAALHLPAVQHATLFDPLSGGQTALDNRNGIDVALKPSVQILVWTP